MAPRSVGVAGKDKAGRVIIWLEDFLLAWGSLCLHFLGVEGFLKGLKAQHVKLRCFGVKLIFEMLNILSCYIKYFYL